METSLGGRRGKQKQQRLPQSFQHPHHHHQLHAQQQQQLHQLHPEQKQQQQQQQQQQKLFHPKSIRQEKFDPCIALAGSSITQNNCSVSSTYPFSQFSTPTEPHTLNKQINAPIADIMASTGGGNHFIRDNPDKNESMIKENQGKRQHYRHRDALDAIEVCIVAPDARNVRSFRGRNDKEFTSVVDNEEFAHSEIGVCSRRGGSNNIKDDSQEKWLQVQKSSSPLKQGTGIGGQHFHHDYSYAYYEPGAAMRHSNIPPPEQVPGPSRPPPPNSIRALLSKGKKNKQLVSQSTRQSFQTRYCVQENFYEEIAGEERNAVLAMQGHLFPYPNHSVVVEELKRVQNRHRKILGELNLSVEAMIMPETPPSGSPTEDEHKEKSSEDIAELLRTVGPTDELLSPASNTNPAFCGDLDSGFSGSSGASFIGSLRYHKTNAALSSLLTNRRLGAKDINNTDTFTTNSCRSSQRSNEEYHQNDNIKCNKSLKIKSKEDLGSTTPVTESKARSFWNRKGWRKLPGFASTSSINETGTDETKLNSGSWEDPLPISTIQAATTVTTAQLHNPAIRRPDVLNSRSSYNGIHNHLIIPHNQQQKNCTITTHNTSGQHHTTPHKRLEHTPSSRTTNSSEDSWCSEREHDLSSEEDDLSERSVSSTTQRNSQLRSTFNKARAHLSFDKWRTSGGGGVNHTINQLTIGGGQNSSTMPAAHHHHHQESTTPGESPGGRLSRWFSIRRGSTHQYDIGGRDGRNSSSSGSIDIADAAENTSPKIHRVSSGGSGTSTSKMPQLPENEDDPTHTFGLDLILGSGSRANGTARTHSRLTTPALPTAPPGLSSQQLKRRHIIAAIVHSENSYVATLQRLVNDYKKPLEDSSPPVLSSSKICTLFHRLPEILQCHKFFRIALADCIRNWDRDEKIGDVFAGAFSKPQVLDVYSGFINNFSAAMELAKMEAKRKSALADFFKVKQISAHDRLSFFGLMVKPVQRFPQFILFLQDLLKYTPQGHHDRMSLQLALTQLESLAEMLNERKREAEQYQAFREMLGHISGTFNTRSLSSSEGGRQRYLLREDNVTQMEFNQSGFIIKSKQRRLLLLNDKVICVSVAPKQSHDFGATEKLSFKWMYPVNDVEIVDNSTSATLSRILTAGMNRGGSLKSNSSSCGNDNATALTNGADNLCNEMSNLMHDYEVISRIHDLVGALKGQYKEISTDITRNLLNSIQISIQKKDEEMAWVDSCCLQLIARNKSGKEETFTFQTENPSVKKEWITELRLAQLALDTNNSPAWEVPEHYQKPSTKMPLFVRAQPVYRSQHQTEVRCGCYYSISNDTKVGTARRRYKHQNYIWICTTDGTSSHIAIMSQHHQQSSLLKDVGSFDLVESQVTSMEFVKGININGISKNDRNSLLGDLIWMGTDSRKILIFSAINPEQEEQIGFCSVPAVINQILYYNDNVFVGLGNGTILAYRRSNDGIWLLKEPHVINLGNLSPVSSLLPINNSLYAGCGNRVYVLNASTCEVSKNFEVHHGNSQQVNLLAHSGIGLWISLKNSSVICLYHTETFKHLQDINIASNVLRVKTTTKECINNSSIYVTALMACKGLLWVGTNVGIALTVPLPRLEGVPVISGGVSISCHAHFGPVTFFLPLFHRNYNTIKNINESTIGVVITEETSNIKEKIKKDDLDETNVVLRKELDETVNNSIQETPKREIEKQNSLDLSITKLRSQLANSPALRRKRYKDINEFSRMSKTLPRGLGSASFFGGQLNSQNSTLQHTDHGYCDVYGLYGKLIFVKEDYDTEDGNQGNLLDFMYEYMRRSDPELAAIPGKVSTLDRRLKMKASRPRSLDLSNWSVDSRSSSLYTSSGSEESMGIRLFGGRSVSRNSSNASHKAGNCSDLSNISENGTTVLDNDNLTTPKNNSIIVQNVNLSQNQTNTNDRTQSRLQLNQLQNSNNNSCVTSLTTATLKKKAKNNNNKNITNLNELISGPRTLLTLMGGRGYWRHVWYNTNSPNIKNSTTGTMTRIANSNDAHIVIWEKKL